MIALPPGVSSEAQARAAAQAQMFPQGQGGLSSVFQPTPAP